MPSRQLFTSSPPLNYHNRHQTLHVLTPLLAFTASACSLIFLLLLCLRNRTRRKRTTPSSDPPHQFSYAFLRRATNSFSTRLGHGGFGPVFSGSLPPAAKPVAVKLMDAASLQGEREFHNELFFASRLRSSLVVPAIGFSSDAERRRFLLVYDLMPNGNLHDALLRRKCPELLQWNKRFAVIVDIAKGIQYLHSCDPPIIHGDIKPSNILLDHCFSAKIADFGLARVKMEPQSDQVEILGVESENKRKEELESDGGSLAEETESVNVAETSPEMGLAAVAASSSTSGMGVVGVVKKNGKANEIALAASGSGPVVKDYVMDWIGKEVKKERPKGEWVLGAASSSGTRIEKTEKKKNRKKLEWWESMDEEKEASEVLKKVKRRPAREWWREEYSEELAKKKKKNKKKQQQRNSGNSDDDLWERDGALYGHLDNKSKTKHRSRNSGGSVDSWLDGGIPNSGGASSTPSMRGTVFYVAPEYGYSGDVSEKCDVYSFGVLLLVIISGRRPLQVMTSSPLSEFQRANLVSWARHCARKGKLLELVDQSIESLDKEQALLCIKVALLCLLKSPACRPSMKEVVGMLSGELEPSQLQHSPSRFPFKSRLEGR